MQLESLWIRKNYGDTALRAGIEFSGRHGKVELNLPEDTTKRLLAVVADLVVEAGQQVARDLTAETIEAAPTAPALASPDDPT